jgi:hypothetical protein
MTRKSKEEPQEPARHPLAVKLIRARVQASEALAERDAEIYRIYTQDRDETTPSKGGFTTGRIGKMFGLTPQQVRRVIASEKIRRQFHGED